MTLESNTALAALGIVVQLAGTAVVVAVAWGRAMERIKGMSAAWRQRQDMHDERLDRIERQLGITDGNGGSFVRRRECVLMEAAVSSKLTAIEHRLANMEARMAHVETAVAKGG